MNTNTSFNGISKSAAVSIVLLLFLVTNAPGMDPGSFGNSYGPHEAGIRIILAAQKGGVGGMTGTPQGFPGVTPSKGQDYEQESTRDKSMRSLPGKTAPSPGLYEEKTKDKSIDTIPSKRGGTPSGSVGSPAGSTPTAGGQTGSTETGTGKPLGGGKKTPVGKEGSGSSETGGGASGQPGQGNTAPGDGWTSATGKRCNWMTIQTTDGVELNGVLCCDPGTGVNCSFY